MFIIGLFSVLDTLMDQPLIDLLDMVILSTDIKLALLDFAGEQGNIYNLVLEYEKRKWNDLHNSDIDKDDFIDSYLTAVNWTDKSMKSLINE